MGEVLVTQFSRIASRLAALEATYYGGSSALNRPLPSVVEHPHSEILILRTELSSVSTRQKDLHACNGQYYVEIGGIRFESLLQRTTWVRSYLLSGAYFLFMDVSILLDMITSSNVFDKELLDEKYQDSRRVFENGTAVKVATSFNRELSSIFGRVYLSSSCGQLVSTHPLPLIKLRKQFNAPDNQSEVNNESFSSWTILST